MDMTDTAAVNIMVWSPNGGTVPEELTTKIEKFVERVLREYEEHEHVRLLTQTVSA